MAKLYTKNTWADEVLAGNERYNILEDGGSTFKSNMQINLTTAVSVAGTSADAAHMNNLENGVDAVDTRADYHNLTAKTTPVDADEVPLSDSSATFDYKKLTWANLKAGVWAAIHAATSKTTPVDADELTLLDSAGAFGVNRLTWANLKATLKTYLDTLYPPADGWMPAGETWTYASGTTFTVSGDQTAKYGSGTKIKLTNSTVKYFYVVSSSYGAPNTTVTVTGGSDYTLANAAISANYYSYAATPAAFPDWFAYTVTWASSGTQPVVSNGTLTGRFKLFGKTALVTINLVCGGSTTFGTGNWTFSLPLTSYTDTSQVWFGTCRAYDSSGSAYYILASQVVSNAAIMQYFIPTTAGTTTISLNATTPFTWAASDQLALQSEYRIP